MLRLLLYIARALVNDWQPKTEPQAQVVNVVRQNGREALSRVGVPV